MNSINPAPDTSDFALMELVRTGNKDAFAMLVRRHQQALLNFFRRMDVYTDAEDLVQETFLRIFKYRDRYRPTAKFTTFLYTVARTTWLDQARRNVRKERLSTALEEESREAAGGNSARPLLKLDARDALEKLPEKLRSVVVLSFYQGLAYSEISDVLQIPVGTVKSRMFLAMEQLRRMFENE